MIELAALLPLLLIAGAAVALFGDGDDAAPAEDAPDLQPDPPPVEEPPPEPEPPVNDLDAASAAPDPAPPEDPPVTDLGGGSAFEVLAALVAAPMSAAPALPALTTSDDDMDVIELEITEAAFARIVDDPMDGEDDGFVARLDGSDVMEITLSDEVKGDLLVLETANHLPSGADGAMETQFALGLYILPEDQALPDALPEGSEEDLVAELGLIKIGTVDLGHVTVAVDAVTGEEIIVEDARQLDLPEIVSNRAVVTASAIFA
ncbi:hypothetical protein [Roseicyclus persicicus]|uniref:Uncharacterized protein n=1 Tax=Roseicyclus persicicus TaxID=2650661 RepID=A0A7X6GXJ3_9RHOB|nr:hypothetical protein [Roseibacterium persicicum]NKX44241.1 hypothetical protein [Roseibacterium persicicum]